LGAAGGTGRLIVRFRLAKGHSVVALFRSEGVVMIEGDARDEGTLTCSLVAKRTESSRLMRDREAAPPMRRVQSHTRGDLLQNDLNHFDRKKGALI
jgi:hypothetical protein